MLEGDAGLHTAHSDTDTLLRILNKTASLLQARGCGVFVWDRDRNVLTAMRPFAGFPDSRVNGTEFPVTGTTLGLTVLQDRAVLLDQEQEGAVDADLFKALEVGNAVGVPLAIERKDENNEVVDRSVMGVLCAFDKYYGRAFDQEDVRLAGIMAKQASAVLVTSQLYWKEVERSTRIMSIIESTSVGLMAVSPKGTVTQVNAAARRALGISREGWFGRNFHEIVSNTEIGCIIEDALGGSPPEEPTELTLWVQGPEGREERIYRVQVDQIRSEDNQSLGWVTVFENVTDIRQAERMMSAFVDMISHELRTPLTSIRGFVATLIQAGEGTFDWPTQEEFLQIVDTEAERLGGMIDEQLNIARIQNGRGLQFHFAAMSLESVIQQVVRLQKQSSIMKTQHRLVVDVPEDFPMVQADEAKVVQILHNLVGNALKYSPNGGEVRIAGRLQDDGIDICVSDQGLGIPPEQVGKMFSQFFRVEGQSHSGIKGTGLGLWLTKHMVEGHGGRLWVESDFGKGSHFHVWLPLQPSQSGGSSGPV